MTDSTQSSPSSTPGKRASSMQDATLPPVAHAWVSPDGTIHVGSEQLSDSFRHLSGASGASGPPLETWEADHEWDLASTTTGGGETGQGGDDLVPDGSIGIEYRTMKAAYSAANVASPRRGSTPHHDPYHGRITEPKTLREPAMESFNLMVVGEAGLGKTTLLESFFQSFKDDEASFALFERKETAIEIETRRQLAEAGAQRNAAERELQAAVEKAQYTRASAKQAEIEQMGQSMAALGAKLKELSAADERQRNELRSLRECCRGRRLEMKRAADQADFVAAAERQLEASILQSECDAVHIQLKQMRRASDEPAGGPGGADDDGADDDDDTIERRSRRSRRALTSATVCIKAFDPFSITVGKHELQVTLVDTPGYGESLDAQESFDVVEQFIDGLFERQLRAESSWSPRDAERLRLQDPLVHVCLYFIAPHRLKHMDIAFMRALHKKVNIVPIIAKSDTMTTKEKEEFKQQLRETLQREGIEAYAFDQGVIRSMEAQDKCEYQQPWAVIGSTDAYLDAGHQVYLRKYPWGDALSSEPAHSDLPALRNLLMWSGQWHDLKMAARSKYELWRASRPLSRRSTTAAALAAKAVVSRAARGVQGIRRRAAGLRSTAAEVCLALGVPPKLAARTLLVLLLALGAVMAPLAVRWATGTDLSASRQLELARQQVGRLGHEKAMLTARYENALAEVRGQLIQAQALAELKERELRERDDALRMAMANATRAERSAADEKGALARSLRMAMARAEACETAAEAASDDCSVASTLVSAARSTGAVMGSWARGAGEHARAASETLAREASERAKGASSALGQLREAAPALLQSAAKDVGAATRRLLAEVKATTKENEMAGAESAM